MTRPRPGRLLASLALLPLVLLTGAIGAATPAGALTPAIDQSHGLPGFCPTGTGVTVVVDFGQLGGETVVRCNPSATPGTGLDALKGAGIQVAGVQRWGEAFICRLENRPSAVEPVPITTDPGYHEACINTPPAQAYWSYWTAGNNCGWQYSQWGVKNREATPGGFEGWSFSLNAGADRNPRPRIAAVRPGTEGGPCSTTGAPGPKTNDPQEQLPGASAGSGPSAAPGAGPAQNPATRPAAPFPSTGAAPNGPGSGASGSGASGSGASGSGAPGSGAPGSGAPGSGAPGSGAPGSATASAGVALPAPLPRAQSTTPVADDPRKNVGFTGGESAGDVTATARVDAGASNVAPWAAGAAMLLLAGLALWTGRRRRRARDGS